MNHIQCNRLVVVVFTHCLCVIQSCPPPTPVVLLPSFDFLSNSALIFFLSTEKIKAVSVLCLTWTRTFLKGLLSPLSLEDLPGVTLSTVLTVPLKPRIHPLKRTNPPLPPQPQTGLLTLPPHRKWTLRTVLHPETKSQARRPDTALSTVPSPRQ